MPIIDAPRELLWTVSKLQLLWCWRRLLGDAITQWQRVRRGERMRRSLLAVGWPGLGLPKWDRSEGSRKPKIEICLRAYDVRRNAENLSICQGIKFTCCAIQCSSLVEDL